MKTTAYLVVRCLIILTLLLGCKRSGAKDPASEVLLALMLMRPLGGASVVYDSTLHAATTLGATANRALASTGAGLPNLQGLRVDQYGDGDEGRGYTDRFATPVEVTFTISRWIGYLPESRGGPPHGQETADNGEPIIDGYPFPERPGYETPRPVNIYDIPIIAGLTPETTLALQRGAGNQEGWLPGILGERRRYDRLGLEIGVVTYVFNETVTNPAYRWLSLSMQTWIEPITGNDESPSLSCAGMPAASHPIFAVQRPVQGNPLPRFSTIYEAWQAAEAGYSMTLPIRSYPMLPQSLHLYGLNNSEYHNPTVPGDQFYPDQLTYQPENTATVSGEGCSSSLLTSAPPTTGHGMRIKPGHGGEMMVFDIPDTWATHEPRITLRVDPTNVLFWDSDRADDGTFNPALDAPMNKPGKDVKLYLPIVSITVE